MRITITLDLDQENVTGDFRKPINADWVDSEEGAITTLTFSDEIPVPVALEGFSPFLGTIHNFGGFPQFEKYARSEGRRRAFVSRDFEYVERCATHFENENWDLFDRESPPASPEDANPKGRVVNLYNAFQAPLLHITQDSPARMRRARQRHVFAHAKEPKLVEELVGFYLTTGRLKKLWTEIRTVRRMFVSAYNPLQPLVQMQYWEEEHRDLGGFKLSTKAFDQLRQLYIDCFETLGRLLVIVGAFEGIIEKAGIGVPTTKRLMPLKQFEEQKNANKRNIISRTAIGDLFGPVFDATLRNGIGHNSAHYDEGTDSIVLHETKPAGGVNATIGCTEFAARVLALFGAFELAAMYHHVLHIGADGKLK